MNKKFVIIIIVSLSSIFSYAPFNIYPLLFIAYTILFYNLYTSKSIKESFLYSFIFGLFHFTLGLQWMFTIMDGADNISVIAITLAVILILAILFGLFGALSYSKKIRHNSKSLYLLLYIPILATLLQYIRSFIFTGFTWYSPRDSVFDIGFASFLPIGGVLFVDFIFFLLISIVVHIILFKKENIIYPFVILFILAITKIISVNITYTTPLDKQIKFHIINSNFSKQDKSSRYKVVYRIKRFTSLALLDPKPDISIWPESTISTNYNNIQLQAQKAIKKLNNKNITVYTGAYVKYNNSTYNSVFDFTKQKIQYAKQHLIPFGEYTPQWLQIVKKLLPNMQQNNLIQSEQFNKTIKYQDINISASICYEITFPSELRVKNNNSNILIHLSDLGWFEQSWVKAYLFNLARIRAIESQKPMVYVVNQGLSAYILKDGTFFQSNDISFYHTMVPMQGKTIWSSYGDSIVLLYIIFLCVLVFLIKKFQRTKNEH